MIMRKLYLEMAQIIIGSFLFDKQWVTLTILAKNNSASMSWPIVFNATFKQIGSRNASQASSLGEAYEASTTRVQVHVTSSPSGTLTYNIIGIGK